VDPGAAAELISQIYVPVRVIEQRPGTDFRMQMAVLPVGTMTAGFLSLATSSRITADETALFHLNLTLHGHAESRRSNSESILTERGAGVLFDPKQDADVFWSDNSGHLCLMIPRETLESEIAALLGRVVKAPLSFAPHLRLDALAGRLLAPVVQMVVSELHNPSPVQRFPTVGRHLEGLVLDGLLLGHQHNYSELLDRPAPAARTPIRRAVELVEAKPEQPWTTVGLAQQVHLSVRALQEGFRREHDLPPMAYVREVRLRRAHRMLLEADPVSIQVQDVAAHLGFLHLGRFSATYRDRFGENPSATLARLAT
jgi:AraC-like DNA-binding protein